MFEVVAEKKMNLERARQARGRWSRDISEIANIFKGVGDVGDFSCIPYTGSPLLTKLCNQVRSLDHFVVQNSGDFFC